MADRCLRFFTLGKMAFHQHQMKLVHYKSLIFASDWIRAKTNTASLSDKDWLEKKQTTKPNNKEGCLFGVYKQQGTDSSAQSET